MTKLFAVVRSNHGKGKYHMVKASGSNQDGSLYGFRTLCGTDISKDTGSSDANWQEVTVTGPLPKEHACRKCWNSYDLGSGQMPRLK